MQPSFLQDAEQWLIRAERDVLSAERTLVGEPILGESTAYHAQQAAEKALKGFLTAHGQPFPKTHLLTPLLEACEAIQSNFAQFANAAQVLSPYAVRFRYPGGPLEPSEQEARTALQLAKEIVEFVRDLLLPPSSQQSSP